MVNVAEMPTGFSSGDRMARSANTGSPPRAFRASRSRFSLAAVCLALTLVWTGSVHASATVPASAVSRWATADEQVEAAKEFAGPDGAFYLRRILVQRPGEELDAMTIILARKPDGTTALVDPDAQVYTGGIDDFRARNNLLTSEDKILVPRDITSVVIKEGSEFQTDTLSGHTEPDRTPWVIGSAAGVMILGVSGLLFARRARRLAASTPGIAAAPDVAAAGDDGGGA